MILILSELYDRKDLNHRLSLPRPGPDITKLSITIKLDSTFLNGHCFLIKVKSETFSGKKYVEGIQERGEGRQTVSSPANYISGIRNDRPSCRHS